LVILSILPKFFPPDPEVIKRILARKKEILVLGAHHGVESDCHFMLQGRTLDLRAIGTPFTFKEVAHLHGFEGWKNYAFPNEAGNSSVLVTSSVTINSIGMLVVRFPR
jgi:hypothetical protein